MGISSWRTGSAIEAHYHVHERGARHVCVWVQHPFTYEEQQALRILMRDHEGDPRWHLL